MLHLELCLSIIYQVLYVSCVIYISNSDDISISNYINMYKFIMSFTEYIWKRVNMHWNVKCPLYAQVFEHLIPSLVAQFWESVELSVHSGDEFFLKEVVTLGQPQVCILRLYFLSCHSASKNSMFSLSDWLCTLKPWDIIFPPSHCFLSSICSDTR